MMLTYSGGKDRRMTREAAGQIAAAFQVAQDLLELLAQHDVVRRGGQALIPRNSGMPDFVIVYIWRENSTRSDVVGLPKPSLRSVWRSRWSPRSSRRDFDRRDAVAEQSRATASAYRLHQAGGQLAARARPV
jgi:hypothetical protein